MTTALAEALPELQAHRNRLARIAMRDLFADDAERFAGFSVEAEGLFLDFSKLRLDRPALDALLHLAEAAGIAAAREKMFAGEAINATEGRPALHVALRAGEGERFLVDGADVVPEVGATLGRMAAFAAGVRDGSVHGDWGPFTDVVNIGIGGSDLGPAMATRALRPFHDGPQLHFVSNVDGAHIADTLAALDPGRTLFLIASKTFTTLETMTNAATARRWLVEALGEGAVGAHFAAASTAVGKAAEFGIAAERVFGFWDWVGGRYSVWSAIGMPLMIAIGPDDFRRFLDGGRSIDRHFSEAPLGENLPVLSALFTVWHRNVWGFCSRAVIPYEQRLDRFPAFLQQLDMESSGKGRTGSGAPVPLPAGQIVWGEPGTNGQHAFFQFLHQGTEVIPVEFLAGAEGHELPEHHQLLLANCLAQGEALMRGRSEEEALFRLTAAGIPDAEARALAPHKAFPGNRPSTTLLYRRLDPFTLGQLIALNEHRVFVEGVLWDVNSFDQWGVELGKELATGLVDELRDGLPLPGRHDGSTAGLIARIAAMREGS